MKSSLKVGSLLALLAIAGCDAPKESPSPGESGKVAEKGLETAGEPSKLVLGPQSPTPPIVPSPLPHIPANVKEGMERKDGDSGPDMAPKAETPK